jgi:hypothetical protein
MHAKAVHASTHLATECGKKQGVQETPPRQFEAKREKEKKKAAQIDGNTCKNSTRKDKKKKKEEKQRKEGKKEKCVMRSKTQGGKTQSNGRLHLWGRARRKKVQGSKTKKKGLLCDIQRVHGCFDGSVCVRVFFS